MDDLIVSFATLADVDAVAAMVNAAYRGEDDLHGWTHEADLLDGPRTDARHLADELSAPDPSTILLLRRESDAAILACVMLQRYRDDREVAICHLAMLTVGADAQNAGLGRRMLQAAEDHARGSGCAVMTLAVIHLRSELVAWYMRRGYRATGRLKPFPYGDPRVGHPKRDDLQLLEFEKALAD